MPNPLDYLKQAYRGATSSVIPQKYTDAAADAIDDPTLERAPWEARLRGFGAGATQGAAEQLNPLNIIASLVPGYRAVRGAWGIGKGAQAAAGVGRAVEGATAGAGALERAAAPTLDIIEHAPVKQIMPAIDDVDSLVGDMTRNLAKIRPTARATGHMPGLGPASGEFVAPGAEAAYNTVNQAGGRLGQYGDASYRELMRRLGGRGGAMQ
jgi:hypothetical protein